MNEPHRGYVNLYSFDRWNYNTDLHIGHYPSALQSLALGDGHVQNIPFYTKTWPLPSRLSHYSRVDPCGRLAWLQRNDSIAFPNTRQQDGCLWREHGVWTGMKQSRSLLCCKPTTSASILVLGNSDVELSGTKIFTHPLCKNLISGM